MPTKYIHEPWLAPIALQKASNCVIGEDYPERLCDHKERRKVCLERLKEVCQQITGTKSSCQETAFVEWKSVLNILGAGDLVVYGTKVELKEQFDQNSSHKYYSTSRSLRFEFGQPLHLCDFVEIWHVLCVIVLATGYVLKKFLLSLLWKIHNKADLKWPWRSVNMADRRCSCDWNPELVIMVSRYKEPSIMFAFIKTDPANDTFERLRPWWNVALHTSGTLMSKSFCFYLFAIGSAHVKLDLSPWPNGNRFVRLWIMAT